MTDGERKLLALVQAEVAKAFDEARRKLAESETATATKLKGVTISSGRDIHKINVRNIGTFWLTNPQLFVLKELIDATWYCASPDVDESYLLRAAGTGHRRLSQAFVNQRAWGQLIVPGDAVATYRFNLAGMLGGKVA